MRALRKVLGFLVLLGVAFASIVVYRRRFRSRGERVDLYFEDGSLVSVEQDATGAAPLLAHAHDAVRAART